MIEVIVAAIASVTLVTCTGLWFTNRVLEREVNSAVPDKIYRADQYTCALCSERYRLSIRFDRKLQLVRVRCYKCKGQYCMRTATAAEKSE